MSIPVPAFIPDFEIEEPEFDEFEAPRPKHRTKPLYAIDTPEERESWRRAYAAWGVQRQKQEVTDEPITILQASQHLSDPLGAPGAPGTLAKRLAAGGWEVKVSKSLAAVPAVHYATDSDEGSKANYRRGDVRFPAHKLESVTLIGIKKGQNGLPGLVVDAYWTRKQGGSFVFQYARTYDPVLGVVVRTTVKTERKPREWEIEAAVMPPWGLEQWVDVVCPKPEKEEK